jgi:hypothetical protein
MDAPRAEAPRDQGESAFTPILRRCFQDIPKLLAALFVDAEGECIDYVSAIDPFEAKVAAAHLHNTMSLFRWARASRVLGESFALEIAASEREVCVRCVGDGYMLIAIALPGADRVEREDALLAAVQEFRAEVGLVTPSWETRQVRLSVRVRAAKGWQYAPAAFSARGVRIAISDVLGRWTEAVDDAVGGDRVCFRVRTQEGQELTLVHEPDSQVWLVRE